MAEIVEATERDAEAVLEVWTAVAAEGRWIGTELPIRSDWAERFRAAVADAGHKWFVASVGGRIVGGATVQAAGGRGELAMAILEAHRGQGIGRRLLDHALSWAERAGCHKVTLEVWPHNERALGLYRAAGFEIEGVRRRQYRRRSGELWDAVAMGLLLDVTSPGSSVVSERLRPPSRALRVAFGTDDHTPVTEGLVAALRDLGHQVDVLVDGSPWPEVGARVGEAVADGAADRGIVCCWTGTGVSIAANKVAGVRAALCTDEETAIGGRRWNDANVLAIGLRLTSAGRATSIAAAFLESGVDDDERATIHRLPR